MMSDSNGIWVDERCKLEVTTLCESTSCHSESSVFQTSARASETLGVPWMPHDPCGSLRDPLARQRRFIRTRSSPPSDVPSMISAADVSSIPTSLLRPRTTPQPCHNVRTTHQLLPPLLSLMSSEDPCIHLTSCSLRAPTVILCGL